MAELLVQAKDSIFDNGAKKGDIIVVRPDGWSWGKEECLPNYIVVKMPKVPVEDVKHYEQTLTKEETKEVDGKTVTTEVLVRKRKYNIDKLEVEKALIDKVSLIDVKEADVTSFKSSVVKKTLASVALEAEEKRKKRNGNTA